MSDGELIKSRPRDWKLLDGVMKASISNDWKEAKTEWAVVDYYESSGESCLCGKENITHCHTIENTSTGETLGPIGSSCIEKFESPTMNEDVSLSRTFVELNKAFTNFVDVDEIRTLLRNKKLLSQISKDNVFDDEKTNTFYGKMVRKRTPGTEKQEAWFKRLLFYDVKPYVQEVVKDYHNPLIVQQAGNPVEQSETLKSNLRGLHNEFSNPTTTLNHLYPYLRSSETIDYLKNQNAFKDDTNEKFFTKVVMGNGGKAMSPKQSQWFRDIISKQIKPFILENVKEAEVSLDMSDLDSSLSL